MSTKQFLGSEIVLLRQTLKLSEGEFSSHIGLEDRRMLKLLESGKSKPSPHVKRGMFKLLSRFAGRYAKLKKLKETIENRAKTSW